MRGTKTVLAAAWALMAGGVLLDRVQGVRQVNCLCSTAQRADLITHLDHVALTIYENGTVSLVFLHISAAAACKDQLTQLFSVFVQCAGGIAGCGTAG